MIGARHWSHRLLPMVAEGSRLGKGRRRITFASVVVLGALGPLAGPSATMAGKVAAGHSIGSFTLSGQAAGRLRLPATWEDTYHGKVRLHSPGCQFTADGPTSLDLSFYNDTLKLGGHKQRLTSAEMTVSLQKDGNVETLVPTVEASEDLLYEAAVGLTLKVGRKTYNWGSHSGTVSSNAKGTTGAISGTFVPTAEDGQTGDLGSSGAASSPINVKGSWSACESFEKGE
jgi:hypothetical protein